LCAIIAQAIPARTTMITTPTPAPISPELLKQAAEVRTRLHAAVGQVVLALSQVPRYRHSSPKTRGADLQDLVLEPLMRGPLDQASIAIATSDGAGNDGHAKDSGGVLAGIAIWATVSDSVDVKIREQIKGGAFPIHLKPDDWTSGDKAWLLDVIAPSQKMASSVLANFKQVVKDGAEVRIHPIVARQVDPELLKKMGAVADGGPAAN
jgi:cytolysin-activating lysine-acyltransferase